MKKSFKLILTTLLVLVLSLMATLPVFAADSAEGTATGTPAILDLSYTAGDTWTMNGITGNSRILHDTIYYTNPQGDTTVPSATVQANECYIDLDNQSNVSTDVYCDISDFTDGDAQTNSDDGSNGAGVFGAYTYYEGMTYTNKVVAKTTGSAVLYDSLAADTDLKVGIALENQSDAFGVATPMTMTYTFYLVME